MNLFSRNSWLGLCLLFLGGGAEACEVYRNLTPFHQVDFLGDRSEVINTGLLIQPKEGNPVLLVLPISVLNGHKRLETHAEAKFGEFEWLWAGELRFRKGREQLELVEANETSGTAAERGLVNSVSSLKKALEHSHVDASGAKFTPFAPGKFEHLSGAHRKLQAEFERTRQALGLDKEKNVSHQMGGRMMALGGSLFTLSVKDSPKAVESVKANLPLVMRYFEFMASDGFEIPNRRAFNRLGRKMISEGNLSPADIREMSRLFDQMIETYHKHGDALELGARVNWIPLSAVP